VHRKKEGRKQGKTWVRKCYQTTTDLGGRWPYKGGGKTGLNAGQEKEKATNSKREGNAAKTGKKGEADSLSSHGSRILAFKITKDQTGGVRRCGTLKEERRNKKKKVGKFPFV